jgi:hypothetical protein
LTKKNSIWYNKIKKVGGDHTLKKKYSLNYEIERDIDRVHAVEDILD